MTKTASAALLALTALIAAPASAQDRPTHRVGYGDLDLSTSQGQATLAKRMRVAVREVCSPGNGFDLDQVLTSQSCRKTAKDEGRRAVELAIRGYRDNAARFASRR